jgi:uncharacterized RDD family membrane protein YckC
MKCQFCSAEIPAGDQFCGQCGARAPAAPPEAPEPPPTPVPGTIFGARADEPPPPPPAPGTTFGAPASEPRSVYGAAEQQPPPPSRWEEPAASGALVAAHRYAGFWIRFRAYLLDTLFATILALIPGFVLAAGVALLIESGQDAPLTAFEADQQDQDTTIAAVVGFFLGFVPVYLAYWWISASIGGGWGKRICGLRIVKLDTGEKPGYGTGAIRTAVVVGVAFVGNIPFVGWIGALLNYLWMIWDPDKQTFHDKSRRAPSSCMRDGC